MRKFMIKPDGGQPYDCIRLDIPHAESATPITPARPGDIMLDVVHNSGQVTELPFTYNQIEEVKP